MSEDLGVPSKTECFCLCWTPRPGPRCLHNLNVPGRPTGRQQASQKLHSKAPKKAKMKLAGGSNIIAMFEQNQIQEFKQEFTLMDQNRDGFIDKSDLRDIFAHLGRLYVGNDELDEMMKERSGLNFTLFLNMFGENPQRSVSIL
ncbi:myosin regulatory light chain 2B, cardiac muscle isoform-like isoform X3 [Siniperca chuatsi]|uniref:myosin regulatory light chain 2B, cardiac muscle isoform-like isoform X3 n=1 Tax=Siniperca chuatsi TaxID=119488 RepID=UPI001CE1FA29|nr:myosin regulatory light chain 2B, cardiac muscle isoform-like isoform X3 [Siniperca chuatsi]